MKKKLDREQTDLWAQDLHRLQEIPLSKEIADVEALSADYYLEALDLDGRDYHTPLALAEAWCDLGWQIPYEDMSDDSRRRLWVTLFDTFGVEPNGPSIDQYTWEVPSGEELEGTATIEVLPTRDERLCLHRITYANGLIEYAIGRPPEK